MSATNDTKKLRSLIALLESKPDIKEVWVNENGDYLLFERAGFGEKKGRKEVLALKSTLPAEETPDPANTDVTLLSDQLAELKGLLNDANNRAATAEYMAQKYAAQVGELVEGESEAELEPRAATWLEERRNWMAEVAQLAGKVSDLEAENTMIREELDTLRSKQNEQPEK